MKYFILLILLIGCNDENGQVIHSLEPNKSLNRSYVLLISLDGYRHDYTEKYKPPFLTKFKKESSRMLSLRPSFPTKTYPNHLSIVTGTYPMNHGIIANKFYAPKLKKMYQLSDRESVKNGKFYTAKPLWILAEEQGLKTADYYWPGAEAEISGKRPSYYFKYNHDAKHQGRIEQVKKWLTLPEKIRPHLITLYFHDVDTAGHRFGPDSIQVKNAILKVDRSLKKIYNSVENLGLDLNIILVSDHGMNTLSDFKKVSIQNNQTRKFLKNYKIMGKGPLIHLYKTEGNENLEDTLVALNSNNDEYKCYKNLEIPVKLNFNNNARIGDIACIANYGFSIYETIPYLSIGGHGWSQYEGMDMHGIFYAKGPSFKSNYEIKTQDNIHIYPTIAKILKLNISQNIDGEYKYLKSILKD